MAKRNKRLAARRRQDQAAAREAKREAERLACPVCGERRPDVVRGRQVTCGRVLCRQEWRRRRVREAVKRFRARAEEQGAGEATRERERPAAERRAEPGTRPSSGG